MSDNDAVMNIKQPAPPDKRGKTKKTQLFI